ncbi:LysR family transcriptional regulator [Telmatospirillum siberiense]|uniref:LysR family transcriptional regulator n=2 Tax=Telmatospirillum siberiense TaxID=382514 RepID=A0A2N3PXV5_9PROT|nr:LysR family transcriptional regulator [Telmatospirillum siberiense]
MIRQLDARLASDLWFFRVAAETGSFSRAGDILAVTQSAVTQRIQRLELRLEVTLFHKAKRGLQLTSAGQALYEATRAGFEGMAAALLQLHATSASGALRVSCVPSLALEWLVPRLEPFLADHPGLDVAIFGEMHNLDRARMVSEGIDIAIRYGPEPPKGSVVAFDHPERVFPVCSAAYRAEGEAAGSARPVVLLHDTEPWLPCASPTDEWRFWTDRHGTPWGRPSQNQFFNLAQLAYRSAVGGMGVALGRSLVVKPLLETGRLVPAVDQEPLSNLRYFIMTQDLSPGAAASAFIAWLQAAMADSFG